MGTIDKIRAEIERRLKDYWKICFHDVKAYNEDSNVRELKELLAFLNTLEEEPLEGLDEAADNELVNVRKKLHEYNCGFLPIHIIESFKHGAEWAFKQK